MAQKLDLKKTTHKHLYSAPTSDVVRVDVPPLPYLMIDGSGDPNTSQAWQDAMRALYSVAYRLKFTSKAAGTDFVVMPLEGLWWADQMADAVFDVGGDREQWRWTALIMQPEHITAALVEDAVAQVRQKRDASPALDLLHFETYTEGPAAQIMHIGPYAAEGPTVAALHAWIDAQDAYTYHGAPPHHEIYLSDPNRTAPDKMRTIIRQPMRPVSSALAS